MIWRTLWLALRLFLDRRVSLKYKLIMAGAVVYLLSPIDLIPDLSALGLVDDVTLLILAINFFINRAPEGALRDHLERMSQDDRVLRLIRGMDKRLGNRPLGKKNGPQDVVEGRTVDKNKRND